MADDTAPAPVLLGIGEAALRSGVSERTLRYYEEIGLLVPASYSPGGSRKYGPGEIARVQQIRELQELIGLNLDEIRTVVVHQDAIESLRAAYHESDDPDERRAIVEEVLVVTTVLHERVAAKVDRMAAFRDELEVKLARYREVLSSLASEDLLRSSARA